MKALVYIAPETLVLRDEPEPTGHAGKGGNGENIVVAVEACGICGSDMHAYLGHDARRPAPLILGHEAVGIALTGQYSGKRVAINPLVTCMSCDACLGGRSNLCQQRQIISMPPRQGAFAAQVAIPERNLVAVADGVLPEHAALTEPMATSYHAVALGCRMLARPLAACHVHVLGGGAIGLAAALILRSQGARDVLIAETNPERRARIDEMPGLGSYDPLREQGAPPAGVADLVVDAVGITASRADSSRLAAPGGVIVHIGLGSAEGGLDIRRMTLQEISFIGTYTYTMVDFRETLAGISSGQFGPLDWIEQRPLADGGAAFQDLKAGRVAASKIVLRM